MTLVLILGPMEGGSASGGDWPVLSLFLLVTGAAVGIAGFQRLGASRTAYPRPLADGRLVTDGIYGWVRHPLYLSLILLSAGWSGWWQSAAAGVTAVALLALLDAKSRVEERWLRECYPEYAAYARRVRRLVPTIY